MCTRVCVSSRHPRKKKKTRTRCSSLFPPHKKQHLALHSQAVLTTLCRLVKRREGGEKEKTNPGKTKRRRRGKKKTKNGSLVTQLGIFTELFLTSLINSPANEVREREKGRGKWRMVESVHKKEGGKTEVSVWHGVGNILQDALMAVLKTQLLRAVYHG